MNTMITCLKMSDYNEKQCAPEVTSFLACFEKFNVIELYKFYCWKSINCLIIILKVDTKVALDKMNAGVVETDKPQRKYPRKFVLKMLDQYKNPRKLDNGPDMPTW